MTVAQLIQTLQMADPTLPVVGGEFMVGEYVIRGIDIRMVKLDSWSEPRLCLTFTDEEKP